MKLIEIVLTLTAVFVVLIIFAQEKIERFFEKIIKFYLKSKGKHRKE